MGLNPIGVTIHTRELAGSLFLTAFCHNSPIIEAQ